MEQWQDELWRKFNLPFDIATHDKLEAARTGNWFRESSLCVARLDKLSRDEEVQAKLKDTDWDLIVCDEAHKMSAMFFGGEAKYTKRYHLGRLLSGLTRHFLLLTATPHNGKEEDFQLFIALIDGDRFDAGRIAGEIIQHLALQPGATVEVTLAIQANMPEGAPDATVRNVAENARTLKFSTQSFEKE